MFRFRGPNTLPSLWMTMLLVYLTVFSSSITATQLRYGDDLTCSSPAYIVVTEATCGNNDNGICSLGDDLHASGTLKLTQDLPSPTVCITTKACLNGYSWTCKTFHNTVNDICDKMNLQAVNRQQCPEAGKYTFDAEVSLPADTGFNFGSGWWMKVLITIDDCGTDSGMSFDCSASVHAVSSKKSYSSTYIAGGAMIGGSLSLLALFLIRKRRIGTINLLDEEEMQQPEYHFAIQLPDSVRV